MFKSANEIVELHLGVTQVAGVSAITADEAGAWEREICSASGQRRASLAYFKAAEGRIPIRANGFSASPRTA